MAVGFVLITTEPGEEVSVRNSLDSVEGVVGRWVVFGSHDLLVKVEGINESETVSYTHLTLPTNSRV